MIRTSIAALALIFLLAPHPSLSAEEGTQPAAPEAEAFTLLIIGAANFSDVDLIQKNVRRIPSVLKFELKLTSRNRQEFTGVFRGDAKALLSDIEGLSADRFEVRSRRDRAQGLTITLKRISGATE